jgi:16S rRNA (cytosine967-C5)-methyltransferase
MRVNRGRATRDEVLSAFAAAGIAAHAGVYAPDAIVLDEGHDPQRLPGFAEGRLTVQGEASQLVALMLGAPPGATVWDACAAPGGKATYIAERLREHGCLYATDVSKHGLAQLRRTADRLGRLGLTNVRLSVADAQNDRGARELPRAVDAALVDAPCSGLGTLRQHPEIRWRRTLTDLTEAAVRQRRLLNTVAQRVRPGGVLVYATCTISRIENEDVVAAFLERHPEFTIVDPRPLLPPAAHQLVDARRLLRTLPHRDGLDGFFAARLQRAG